MTVDDHLRRIRQNGYRMMSLVQLADGNWQAILFKGGKNFNPVVCLTAADALDEAFKRTLTAAPPVSAAPDQDLFG